MFNSNKLQRERCELIINRARLLRALLSARPEYIAHRMSRSDFVIPERIIFPHPLSNIYPWHSSQFSGGRGIVRARGGVAQFTFVMCEPGMAHLKKLIRCPRRYISLPVHFPPTGPYFALTGSLWPSFRPKRSIIVTCHAAEFYRKYKCRLTIEILSSPTHRPFLFPVSQETSVESQTGEKWNVSENSVVRIAERTCTSMARRDISGDTPSDASDFIEVSTRVRKSITTSERAANCANLRPSLSIPGTLLRDSS